MKIENKLILVLLLMMMIIYLLIITRWNIDKGNSFLIGGVAAILDMFLLNNMVKKVFKNKATWLIFPLSLFRWILFSIIIFIGLYIYKADPIFISSGVVISFISLFIEIVYNTALRSKEDGTSS